MLTVHFIFSFHISGHPCGHIHIYLQFGLIQLKYKLININFERQEEERVKYRIKKMLGDDVSGARFPNLVG